MSLLSAVYLARKFTVECAIFVLIHDDVDLETECMLLCFQRKRGMSSDSNMPVIDNSKKLKTKELHSKPAVHLTSKQRKRQAKCERKRKTQVSY